MATICDILSLVGLMMRHDVQQRTADLDVTMVIAESGYQNLPALLRHEGIVSK
jgi:hypothetical protein